jgi:hypothetical protein
MGYYIETKHNKGKAGEIASTYNGKIVTQSQARLAMGDNSLGVIVVINNYIFEAAGFAFDMKEFEDFTLLNDLRSKTFVVIPRNIAEVVSGFVKNKFVKELEQKI